MNLKLKFLIIFSVAAFSVLSFFSYVAFDTAAQQNQMNESKILFDVFQHDINNMGIAVKKNENIDGVASKIEHSDRLTFLVYDENHRQIFKSKLLPAIPPENISELPLETSRGEMELNETELHWFTQNVPNSNYTVAAFYAENNEIKNSFISQMAVTLIISAFVVLWAAAWSAVYLGSLFDRLNSQKEKLEKLATHDSLTALPNRMLLNDRIEQAILRARREKTEFGYALWT